MVQSTLKISIVTPNYNYGNYINKTVESVLKQSYTNFEHIIVDDGSTDHSVEVIRSYISDTEQRIILIEQENKGQTAAINEGLLRVTGDIIGWINSDDTYCQETFERVILAFEKNSNTDIVFGDMNVVDLQGRFMIRRRHINYNRLSGIFLGHAVVFSSNAIFWKRSAMEANGLPDVSLLCNMDGEYFSRLVQGQTVVRIPAALSNFRKQPQSKAAEKNKDWDQIIQKEISFELRNAYQQIWMSNLLPYASSLFLKIVIRVIRIIKRFFHLHYFKQKKEMKRYLRSNKAVL